MYDKGRERDSRPCDLREGIKVNHKTWSVFIASFIFVSLAACAPSAPTATPRALDANPNAAPTDIWIAIQERTPYPYATPLPPATVSAIDGIYAKYEPIIGEHVPCRRCPDYASDGGVWLLRFDKGIYRIYSELIGWRNVGSYTVSGERLILFNDGYCADEIGIYAWTIEQRKLILKEVKDDCSIHLRAKNLTLLPWASCLPPNREAAITEHWQSPQGCR